VGHHAQHVAAIVEHAGDIALRTVDRFGIAERHAAFAFQPVERFGIGVIVAVMVRDRDVDPLARVVAGGEQRLAGFDLQRHVAADEADAGIAHQRAGQQAGFGQHLKAVAHAQHRHAAFGGADHRRITGERAAIAPERR
jgi:hypothetical protein